MKCIEKNGNAWNSWKFNDSNCVCVLAEGMGKSCREDELTLLSVLVILL